MTPTVQDSAAAGFFYACAMAHMLLRWYLLLEPKRSQEQTPELWESGVGEEG